MLEDTYQDADIHCGEEVEVFARYLDDCVLAAAASAEQRANYFKLIDRYYDYANERAETLRERQRLEKAARGGGWSRAESEDNSGHESNDMDLDEPRALPAPESSELQRWEDEAQTWDLLRRLLPLRYRDNDGPRVAKSIEIQPQSRREYWTDFVQSEPKAREKKTILEWLQRNASKGPDIDELVQDLQRSADRGDIVAHGWLHTRGAIKQHKRLVASAGPLPPSSEELENSNLESSRKLVTQLDPDVVRRQNNRSLAVQDESFEKAIWLGCYELLRRGRSMAEVRDWCQERTEVWRAATFSALPLVDGEDEDVPNFEPYSTVLWRRMCVKLAQDDKTKDEYERAVYGILSGDMTSVDRVCKTWDDFVFSKFNAELRSQFDAYLTQQCDEDQIRSLSLIHGEVLGPVDSPARDETIRQKVTSPAKALHAAIIDNKLDTFFYHQGLVFAEHANAERPSRLIPHRPGSGTVPRDDRSKFIGFDNNDWLRVLAHIQIIVSALDSLDGKDVTGDLLLQRYEVQQHVIAGYTSFIRLGHMEEVLPLYSSRLSGDRRYSNLSRNLIHIESREMQHRLMQLMKKYGLDIVQFVRDQPMLFLSEILAQNRSGVVNAQYEIKILGEDVPQLKYGRPINRYIFGEPNEEEPGADADDVVLTDRRDELLIRSMEWLLMVDTLLDETLQAGIKIYKYFLRKFCPSI
jgi:nuclear pore complex protein Nup107